MGSESERIEQFKRWTRSKLAGIRCPDHRQPPRLRFLGSTLHDLRISLSGCCPKLMEQANRAVAGL